MRTATIRRKLSEVRAETILDEERHVYGVPGWDTTIELPSVSAILDMVAPWDWEAPWEALGHGQAIHAALHYLDEGDLDEASVAPSIRPYVDRYKEWLEFAGYEVVASEVPLALAKLGYGGKFDRLLRERCACGRANCARHFGDLVLADFKRSRPDMKRTALQLCGYEGLLRAALNKPTRADLDIGYLVIYWADGGEKIKAERLEPPAPGHVSARKNFARIPARLAIIGLSRARRGKRRQRWSKRVCLTRPSLRRSRSRARSARSRPRPRAWSNAWPP